MEQWSSYISEFCREGYLASPSSVSNDHTALRFDGGWVSSVTMTWAIATTFSDSAHTLSI